MTAETRPLFDGDLAITVGGVDVTAAARGLRFSSTSPGGFGEASFRLPCADRAHDNSDGDAATWNDLSGNGNDGTLTGFAYTSASGWGGDGSAAARYCLALDGSDDRVVLPVLDAPSDKACTYEAWFRGSSAKSCHILFVGTATEYLYLGLAMGGYPIAGYKDSAAANYLCYPSSGTWDVFDGEWHHVGVVLDGDKLSVYLDGVCIASRSDLSSGTLTPTVSTIGRNEFATPGGYLLGDLAAVRVHSTALSDDDMAQGWNVGPTGSGYVTGDLVLDLSAARAVPQDPHAPYDSAVVRDADVVVTHGAQTLFQGVVTNDLDVGTVADGEAYYEVAAAGKWYEATLRTDFCRTLSDAAFDAWEGSTRSGASFEVDTNGRLALIANAGTTYKAYAWSALHYWLDRGLGDPERNIDHLLFVLGDHGDGNGRGIDLSLSSSWRINVRTGEHPWHPTQTTALTIKPPAQVAAGTIYRVPATPGTSFAEPARSVTLRLYLDSGSSNAPVTDRYLIIREMYVMTEPDYYEVDAITGSLPATVETTAAHGLKVGDRVFLWGADVATYNGIWTVLSVPSTTTFTIDARGASAASSGVLERLPSPVDLMAVIGASIGGGAAVIDDSSYAAALPGSVVVRPQTTPADAMDALGDQFAVPQSWGWWEGGDYAQTSLVLPADPDYVVDCDDPGVLYDVHTDDEAQVEYVRVLHKLAHTVGLGQMQLRVTYTPNGGGAAVTVECPLLMDGRLRSASNSYATAAAGGAAVDQATTTDDTLWVGSNKAAATPVYRLHEAFVSFSLASVPSDATVTDAELTALPKRAANIGYLEVLAYDWGSGLTSADWRTPVQLSALPQAAVYDTDLYPLTAGERFTFDNVSLVARLQAALGAGVWRAVVVDEALPNGDAPTGAAYIGLCSVESDTTPDPLVGQVVSTLVGTASDDPGYEPDAARVAVLDLSQHLLSTADAQAEGARYLALLGSAAYHGRITVKAPTVGLHGGGTKLAAYVRAGETIEEQNAGVVLWIRAADYDVDSSTLTLDVGVDPTEYRYLPPGQRNELGG